MNKIFLFSSLFVLVILLAFNACSSPATPTTTTSPATSMVTVVGTGVDPVVVVSVVGPLPPINPGGPKIEVTLKNNALNPVISLNANLGIDKPGTDISYDYSFNVTSSTPLLPGNSVSSSKNLIGGGFNSDQYYPLLIRGELQDGETFRYTADVKITPTTTATNTTTTNTTASLTTPQSVVLPTFPSRTAQEPVALVSIGTITPINPGGPTIEIVLKNVSAEPVIDLIASLGIKTDGPSEPFVYSFNVSAANPLQPGESVKVSRTIIGGGFGADVNYGLAIHVKLQSGKLFNYTKQAKISAPAQ